MDSIASEEGYSLLVCNTGEDAEKEDRILSMLKSRRVDGLLIASARSARTRDGKRAYERLGVPVVFVDRRLPGLHFVGDDEAIGLRGPRTWPSRGIAESRTLASRGRWLRRLGDAKVISKRSRSSPLRRRRNSCSRPTTTRSRGVRSHAEAARSAAATRRRICGK